jgi:hypothetical protein
MRRQRRVRIEKIGVHRGDREDTVVDPVLRRNVAADGRYQHRQWNAGPGPAVAPPDDGMAGKAFLPVFAGVFAEFGQNAGEALMRLGQVRIDGQCGLILVPGGGEITCFIQQIGVADMCHHVAGMTSHGLTIGVAGGGHETAGMRQGTEFGQRAAMHRIGLQDVQIGQLRRLVIAFGHQRPGAGQGSIGYAEHFGTSRFWKKIRAYPGGQSSRVPNWEKPIFS